VGAYVAAVVLVTIQLGVLLGHPGVFFLYRDAFFRLIHGQNLYATTPGYYGYLYSPTFALLFAPFAIPWPLLGLLLWNAVNAGALYVAVQRLIPGAPARLALAIAFLDLLRSLQNSQSNGLVAALVVLAFVALERGRPAGAAAALAVDTAIKLFPLAAVSLGFFQRRPLRFGLALAGAFAVLALLPLLVIPAPLLIQEYWWWLGQTAAGAVLRGMSVMGILHSWAGLDVPNVAVQAAGTVLLLVPVAWRRERWREYEFRRLFLCSLLVYMVIFNHQAESPSFVIATTGIGIWYATAPRRPWRDALLILTLLVVSVFSLQFVPARLRWEWTREYSLKAFPCLLAWLAMQWELLARGPAVLTDPES